MVGMIIAAAWLASDAYIHRPAAPATPPPPSADEGEVTVRDLFDSKTGDTVVTVAGVVVKILADDNEGSRHQRFLIEVPGDVTVLVAHNIDLAQRIPLDEGDAVTIRGEYEWTDKGGTIHWTHHDPQGWHEDGWIEHNGRRYG